MGCAIDGWVRRVAGGEHGGEVIREKDGDGDVGAYTAGILMADSLNEREDEQRGR
jgi:hypothetical protein